MKQTSDNWFKYSMYGIEVILIINLLVLVFLGLWLLSQLCRSKKGGIVGTGHGDDDKLALGAKFHNKMGN